MPVVGLTGSIASGKSLVSRILTDLGIRVIDADLLAREVVQPGQPAWREIKNTFGEEVLNPDGSLNRKLIAAKVFNNKQLLNRLNAITHPVIIEKISDEINFFRKSGLADSELLVVDVPLLIETGFDKKVDKVWVVYVPEEIHIRRLMERDGISAEQARKRLASQMAGPEKIKYADEVIDNSGTIEGTRRRVEELVQQFIETRGGKFEP